MNNEQSLLERFINLLMEEPETARDTVDLMGILSPRNIQVGYKLAAIFKPDELERLLFLIEGFFFASDTIYTDHVHAKLTRTELKILELTATGQTTADIADTLGVISNTVIKHRENIRAKMKIGPSQTMRMAVIYSEKKRRQNSSLNRLTQIHKLILTDLALGKSESEIAENLKISGEELNRFLAEIDEMAGFALADLIRAISLVSESGRN